MLGISSSIKCRDHTRQVAFDLLTIDRPMSIERGGHADVREGVQAFLEKRSPTFPGAVSKDMPSQYPWWR